MFCDYRFNISLSFSIIPLITLILIIIIRFRYKTDYDLRKISMNWDLDLIINKDKKTLKQFILMFFYLN